MTRIEKLRKFRVLILQLWDVMKKGRRVVFDFEINNNFVDRSTYNGENPTIMSTDYTINVTVYK